ncbi:MAG: DUF3037 domain-containing protein [Phycisphaeraceae bacterium]
MSDLKGYYSLVQFCPDLSRAEAVNVGVLLFCPQRGFIAARTQHSNERVRKFFGADTFDGERLNAAKEALEKRLQTEHDRFSSVDDLNRFISTRANELVLTAPRSVKVDDPDEDIELLFAELVGGRAKRRPKPSLLLKLDEALRRPSLLSKVKYGEKVNVPIINRVLDIPYTYRNGERRLVKPQLFGPSNAIGSAMQLAIEGDLLHKHPTGEGKRQLIVVSDTQGVEKPADLRRTISTLFSDYNVRTIWPEQIAAFADEVEKVAH